MITSIIGVAFLLMFVISLYVALEYREQYNARIERYEVEEEFVKDYLETQDALKLCTYVEGGKVIDAFKARWEQIISHERVEYFVQQMHKSLDLRVLYQVNAN
jgi:5'-deoxynucleotidase YfbR-like HD superfamily hydrolase